MADEKKPAAGGGGDLEAAYQEIMGTLDGIYTKNVDKEQKKASKEKGGGKQ